MWKRIVEFCKTISLINAVIITLLVVSTCGTLVTGFGSYLLIHNTKLITVNQMLISKLEAEQTVNLDFIRKQSEFITKNNAYLVRNEQTLIAVEHSIDKIKIGVVSCMECHKSTFKKHHTEPSK